MNYKEIIEEVYEIVRSKENKGHIASYIPELASADPDNFAIHISTIDNYKFGIGNFLEKFSIQSIAKILSLSLAYKIVGEKLWERLGVEPSGTSFNSLSQLELDNGIPRNPFVNSGALVICDILLSLSKNAKEDFLEFGRSVSYNQQLNFSSRIADSEKSAGYRNVALCNFIKSYGNIINEPEVVLDFYYCICSLEINDRNYQTHFFIWPMMILEQAAMSRF